MLFQYLLLAIHCDIFKPPFQFVCWLSQQMNSHQPRSWFLEIMVNIRNPWRRSSVILIQAWQWILLCGLSIKPCFIGQLHQTPAPPRPRCRSKSQMPQWDYAPMTKTGNVNTSFSIKTVKCLVLIILLMGFPKNKI